jgi:hypothetical protein
MRPELLRRKSSVRARAGCHRRVNRVHVGTLRDVQNGPWGPLPNGHDAVNAARPLEVISAVALEKCRTLPLAAAGTFFIRKAD